MFTPEPLAAQSDKDPETGGVAFHSQDRWTGQAHLAGAGPVGCSPASAA